MPVGVAEIIPFEKPAIRGFLHRPRQTGQRGLVLTHGAGGNCKAPLLAAAASAFADAGLWVLRCDLPFRQRRTTGPPSPAAAAADRAGLKSAVEAMRELVDGGGFSRRAVVWRATGDDARRRRARIGRGSAAVLVPAASARQTRPAAHRAFSAAAGAGGVCSGHRRPVRLDRGGRDGDRANPGANPADADRGRRTRSEARTLRPRAGRRRPARDTGS